MSLMNRTQINKVLFLVTFWLLAATFIVCYEGVALEFEGVSYNLPNVLVSALWVTLFSGAAIAAFEVFYFHKLLRKIPFGYSLLLKTGFYLANIFVFNSVVIIWNSSSGGEFSLFSEEVWERYWAYLSSPRMFMTIAYWGIAVMLGLFILQVSEKLGQGVLLNLLLGKYHQPREELRLFLFMDLKSSTNYAERLGHIKYSQLIQDCYFDLTDMVTKYRAQIYQYVGDEVVLTWKIRKKSSYAQCLKVFFDYARVLKARSGYYTQRYGVVPRFKAGADVGWVTVAEVGEIKKELAYHGNVLNTACRIMERCNEFNVRILVSETIWEGLTNNDKPNQALANLKLKGKQKAVRVYTLSAQSFQLH